MWLNKYSLESIPNKLSKELGEDISLEDVKSLIVDKKLDLWFLGHYIGRGKGESFHCVSNDKDSLYHILYGIGDKDKIIKVGGSEDIIYILKQGSYKNMTVTRHDIDVSGGLYIYGEILKKFVQNEKQGNQAIIKQLPIQAPELLQIPTPTKEEERFFDTLSKDSKCRVNLISKVIIELGNPKKLEIHAECHRINPDLFTDNFKTFKAHAWVNANKSGRTIKIK